MKRFLGFAAIFGWLMASVPVQAHHSVASVYDMKTPTSLTGTVAKVLFINPHGSITVTVTNSDGTKTDWTMTLGSVTAIADKGMGRTGPNALHPGDTITVKFLPAKDGSPIGLLRSVTFADGHTIVTGGSDPTN
jgi:hypothetical protein